jgi:hypothetical protein
VKGVPPSYPTERLLHIDLAVCALVCGVAFLWFMLRFEAWIAWAVGALTLAAWGWQYYLSQGVRVLVRAVRVFVLAEQDSQV